MKINESILNEMVNTVNEKTGESYILSKECGNYRFLVKEGCCLSESYFGNMSGMTKTEMYYYLSGVLRVLNNICEFNGHG